MGSVEAAAIGVYEVEASGPKHRNINNEKRRVYGCLRSERPATPRHLTREASEREAGVGTVMCISRLVLASQPVNVAQPQNSFNVGDNGRRVPV